MPLGDGYGRISGGLDCAERSGAPSASARSREDELPERGLRLR